MTPLDKIQELAQDTTDRLSNKRWNKFLTGDKIRTLRIDRGLTQQQLANLMGVTEGAVRKYEFAKAFPKPNHLEKMAKALQVRPECLSIFITKNDSLSISDIDYGDAVTANALFQLGEVYGFEPHTADDFVYLKPTNTYMNNMLDTWTYWYEGLKNDQINEKEYRHWKDSFNAEYDPHDFPMRFMFDKEIASLIEPWENYCLGKKLKSLRAQVGLKQADLANNIEVSLGVYKSYEQGRRLPKKSIIERLAEELHVTYASLAFFNFGSPIQAVHCTFQLSHEFGLRPDIWNDQPILRTQAPGLEAIISHWSDAFTSFKQSNDKEAYCNWKDHYDPEQFPWRVISNSRYTEMPEYNGKTYYGFSKLDTFDPKYEKTRGILKS